jgi:LL-diaminopimelate aminotransferase
VKPGLAARVGRLPGYPLAEIPRRKRELIAAGMDVIDLGAGDSDVPPPDVATESLRQAVGESAMSRYGFQQGLPAFREAVARYHRRRFDTELDPAREVLPLLGSKEGLAHFAQAVAQPGDVVIVPEPGYQCYLGGAILSGATPHIYPLRRENDFLVELSELPSDVLSKTKLVFLNYPNNPTAAVAPLEYLERTVSFCRSRGIALAYDNPYVELTFDGYVAPSVLEIVGAREVTVEFHSLSKSFAMTGWRLGWAAGNRDLIAALTKLKSYVDTGPFLAVQRAGADVLDHSEELVRPAVERLAERRDAAVEAFRAAGFDLKPPSATMYLWVSLPEGVESAEFCREAMEDHGVITLPGSAFGPSAEGFFRVALTVEPPRLVEAAARMGKVLARA